MHGWTGKLLRVDLTTRKTEVEAIPETWLREYLGGRGLGVRYAAKEIPAGADPLAPEMPLYFFNGPLTASRAPTSGRFSVISKSPLTGTIFDSNSGGQWATELKRAGLDGIAISGAADKPVMLSIANEKAEIRDAAELWGLDTAETQVRVREMTDAKARVICIGPAGEKRVLLSALINDRDRAAGRGGLAAIAGAKNLKAISVRGTGQFDPADGEALQAAAKRAVKAIKKNPVTGDALPTLGTAVLVNVMHAHGMLPTRNFTAGTFNNAEGISGEKITERILEKRSGCFNCPIACGRTTRLDDESGEGPEYETAWSFGAQCGISNLEAVTRANYRCNRLGLDTISMGSTIGCAMELSERGLLGEELSFGDAASIVGLVEDTALARGLGQRLGQGSKRLAEDCGAPDAAMHVKGLELPAYDPRGAQGHALSYVTSNRGGCHLRAYMISPEILGQPCLLDRFSTKGKAELVIVMQDLSAAVDGLVLCRFVQFAMGPDPLAEMLSAAIGEDVSGEELMRVGARTYALERLFNAREGFGRKDDILPPRFLESPLAEGASRGRLVELGPMLDEYYALRGWDDDGRPGNDQVAGLNLPSL